MRVGARPSEAMPPQARPTVRRLVAIAAMLAVVSVGCAGGERPVLTETSLEPIPAATAVPIPDPPPTPIPQEPIAGEAEEPEPGGAVVPEGCITERQWLGQLIMTLATPDQFPAARPHAERGELGGITLLDPDSTVAQIVSDLDAAGPFPVLMASDEEGGIVQRLTDLIYPLPAAQTQTERPAADVQAEFADYGRRMKELGFDIAFAPVVDIGGGPGIGTRSFSDDPAVVVEYARAVTSGLREAGVIGVYKHFPGHGRASADSHLELPVTPAYSDMATLDLIPYDELLADSGAAVMVGHLSVPGLSDETPTSLSPNTVTRLLRGRNGETFEGKSYNFNGLVFTDALNMGAITNTYSGTEAVVRALAVGADVAIVTDPESITPSIDALSAALSDGRMAWDLIDQSVQRVLGAKGVLDATRCPA